MIKLKGIYINGTKEGVWTKWDLNGKIEYKRRYANDCDISLSDKFTESQLQSQCKKRSNSCFGMFEQLKRFKSFVA